MNAELAIGIQSERKASRPASSLSRGNLGAVHRPALMDRTPDNNLGGHADEKAPVRKEVPITLASAKGADEANEADKLSKGKASADIDAGLTALHITEGPTADDEATGAVEASTGKQLLLQGTGRLEPDNESGTTPLRTAQPTPANSPVGAIDGSLSRPVAGVHHQSRLSVEMRLEEEMMTTPLSGDELREFAGMSFMQAAAQAIAQAATYPELHGKAAPAAEASIPIIDQIAVEERTAAVPSQKRTTTLTSVIISGDQAAMNRAPAPQEAAVGMEEKPVQEKLSKAVSGETKVAETTATADGETRTIVEIQRDLKNAIKMKHAAKKVVGTIPALESSAYPGISPADAAGLQDDASSALCEAMGELGIKPEVRKPLRGLPLSDGRHTRFSDSGTATESPTGERVLLRGVPAPSGGHLRFQPTP
ncbi:hypothetical protein CVIRNUC_005101 [Coccomyxa viridis]|uniref:Uncharacterized protein n=1 Tax=Coccomyxa viridis TaxID=1274662 RepID=A0AAV1I3M1_9CHLO|nr:hypothetical protein CVIRNUC_005101 [Coccomyxa viridis]